MAKCSSCGRKGLFLKVDKSTGLCQKCQIEHEQTIRLEKLKTEISDHEALLEQAKNEARTQAQIQLAEETAQLKAENDKLAIENVEHLAKRDKLTSEVFEAQKTYDNLVKRTVKLKPLAASIKSAYEKWLNAYPKDAVREIESLDIEN